MGILNETLGLVQKYSFIRNSSSRQSPARSLIKRIGLVFVSSGGGSGSSRAQFETPEFDLEEISAAYDTEAYVRQAVDKYTDLIFKAGWDIVSSNESAREYVKTRLSLIAEATQTPTEQLFTQIAEDLVKYSNAFIVKARLPKSGNYKFPKGIQVKGIGDEAPVVGYFVLPPETIKIARDKNGTIKGYQQQISGAGNEIKFRPQDIIHIKWKQKRGQAFGTPFLTPVLADIRLLREIEDNVNRLLHKYLHPLYKFKVGLDKEGYESTPEEVEYVREEIMNMQTDGTLVLPERYDVDIVGAQGEYINAEWALKYFEQRVFTGLGVPETVFGRSATANRSTADNLTSEMHDRVKAFQRVLAEYIDNFIINEILLEGGFDPILNPEDDTDFKFKEIAIDEQIKLENQATYLYEHNMISFPEARQRIGYDPEVQDENMMYLNRVQIFKKNQSSEEPGSPETNNKVKPENQHGKKTSPKKTSASYDFETLEESAVTLEPSLIKEFEKSLIREYENLRADTIESIRTDKKSMIPMAFHTVENRIGNILSSFLKTALREGIYEAKKDVGVQRHPDVKESLALQLLQGSYKSDIEDLLETIKKITQSNISEQEISSSFDVLKYRVSFIARTSMMKAYNYGYALSAQSLGKTSLFIQLTDSACVTCKSKAMSSIALEGDILSKIPPWHANCWCELKFMKNGGDQSETSKAI